MNTEQILQVIDAISQSSLSEFKYEGDGVKFSMKKPDKKWKKAEKAVSFSEMRTDSQPVNGSLEAIITEREKDESSEKQNLVDETRTEEAEVEKKHEIGNIIKSPLVGTFYAAPSEDSDSFVRIGDHVEKGQILAIIEAMKLMNEIESDFAGTVAEILVENGEPVEYGQSLFVIR